MAHPKPISVPKGSGAVVIQPSEYKGVDYIDVRNFYKPSGSDELKPTPKGIMVPVDLAEEVAQAILVQLKAFKAAKSAPEKLYIVTTKTFVSNKKVSVSENRVFESMSAARQFSGKGPVVMYAVIGDFTVHDTTYVWENAKVRKVAVRENGKWAKLTDLK